MTLFDKHTLWIINSQIQRRDKDSTGNIRVFCISKQSERIYEINIRTNM